MHTRHVLLVLITALLATLMWLGLQSPIPELDPATVEALEAATEEWWRPGDPTRTVPESEWPPELRRLRPRVVRATPKGVFISFASYYVEERGLFVLPTKSDYQPQQGTDPAFRVLCSRVYVYGIKG
ncbi:MAG: hypothetical protein C0467_08505 [Planctomycetaceae bacterium]|nr:hypothetical protein [Planctomycetaceae bacterium]